MNTTGGPHVLLFERDQQLAALLTSELQLAGFECHTARTAVEVFDTIARFPVRMVLVNLAQAAAGRREFWVALDTQRRGRGVQVFTFHCTNIAGYGAASDDSDDRQQTILADMEVAGMTGIMNLVATIRSRLIVSNTGAISRLSASAEPPTLPVASVRPAAPPPVRRPTPPPAAANMSETRPAAPSVTDKIRAVIHPGQRSWNVPASREVNGTNGNAPVLPQPDEPASAAPAAPPVPPRPAASAQTRQEPAYPNESGLSQLSRMLQEHQAPAPEPSMPLLEELARGQHHNAEAPAQLSQTGVPKPPGTIAMRASPIEDLPSERPASANGRVERPVYAAHPAAVVEEEPPPLLSIPLSVPPAPETSTEHDQEAPPRPPVMQETELQARAMAAELARRTQQGDAEPKISAPPPALFPRQKGGEIERVEDNAVLLDIMQSLPPMPSVTSPLSQPQVLSGRATRSLGNVLLEGHLVSQDRLDVAQNIQHMLRGVDMNYQLGEILLMFKLLTPDQLLAASLVSYGLLTTTQIRALGRIRQELHAISLEYDLENLLILFRILTSEQLREVRASWSG